MFKNHRASIITCFAFPNQLLLSTKKYYGNTATIKQKAWCILLPRRRANPPLLSSRFCRFLSNDFPFFSCNLLQDKSTQYDTQRI